MKEKINADTGRFTPIQPDQNIDWVKEWSEYKGRGIIKHEIEFIDDLLFQKDEERETAVRQERERRDKQWKDAINYLIQNSEGSQEWFDALRACRAISFNDSTE